MARIATTEGCIGPRGRIRAQSSEKGFPNCRHRALRCPEARSYSCLDRDPTTGRSKKRTILSPFTLTERDRETQKNSREHGEPEEARKRTKTRNTSIIFIVNGEKGSRKSVKITENGCRVVTRVMQRAA